MLFVFTEAENSQSLSETPHKVLNLPDVHTAAVKPTVSSDTLSAIWFVWWRKRTVDTSPNAAKHLERDEERERVRERRSENIQSRVRR